MKFLWLLLTGRMRIAPRERWVTCETQSGHYLHCRHNSVPRGCRVVVYHNSFDAMTRWIAS